MGLKLGIIGIILSSIVLFIGVFAIYVLRNPLVSFGGYVLGLLEITDIHYQLLIGSIAIVAGAVITLVFSIKMLVRSKKASVRF